MIEAEKNRAATAAAEAAAATAEVVAVAPPEVAAPVKEAKEEEEEEVRGRGVSSSRAGGVLPCCRVLSCATMMVCCRTGAVVFCREALKPCWLCTLLCSAVKPR